MPSLAINNSIRANMRKYAIPPIYLKLCPQPWVYKSAVQEMESNSNFTNQISFDGLIYSSEFVINNKHVYFDDYQLLG